MKRGKASPDEFFVPVFMCRKSRRIVNEYMERRPYYGTKQDKELNDAKDRARADRHRDD